MLTVRLTTGNDELQCPSGVKARIINGGRLEVLANDDSTVAIVAQGHWAVLFDKKEPLAEPEKPNP